MSGVEARLVSRDTFLLASPISSQDPVQRCYLDLYGNTPHEPHPWAELVQQFRHLKEHLRGPFILTGYQCPGRREDHSYVTLTVTALRDGRMLWSTERGRQHEHDPIQPDHFRFPLQSAPPSPPRPKLRFPFDLIDPSTIELYWPEDGNTE
jgi:hypothetical protein